MKKSMATLLLPLFVYSDSLKELIVYAQQNNDLLRSKALQKESKAQELENAKSSAYPTIDLGATYKRDDEPQPFSPGTIYSGFAKLTVNIYSGSARHYKTQQKKEELLSSGASYEASKKGLALEIVQNFYQLKSMYSLLKAQEESAKAVEAQLQRVKQFYEAKLATSDEVDRLQAAYDKSIYAIESLKFEILSVKKLLELQAGKEIRNLEDSSFQKIDETTEEKLDAINALKYQKRALMDNSELLDRFYYPHIKLEDTFSVYGYQDEPDFGNSPFELLDKQNVLLLSANIRIFDFGTQSEAKQAVQLQARALESEIAYKTKEQQNNILLAKERIKTAKLNLISASSAMKASQNAFNTITQKYTHKIVDNVVYLDALSSYTESQATYYEALNNLEIAYGMYYFYNGKKLEEFLNE